MEAIPQSLLEAGIVSLEIGSLLCLLTGNNVNGGQSQNGKSAVLSHISSQADVFYGWKMD